MNWGRNTRPVAKKPSESDFGVRSCVSHNDATSTVPLSPGSPLLATFFHHSPKTALLAIPDPTRSAPLRDRSRETLLVEETDHQRMLRSQSLPVDAVLRTETPIPSEQLDKEINQAAVPVTEPATRAPTPPPKDEVLTETEPVLRHADEPVEPLPNIMEMLTMVEHRLSKLNYGAVNILAHYDGISPTYSWKPLGWDPLRGIPLPQETPNATHKAFEGMLCETSPGLERLAELDVECQMQGRLPGSTTVAGIGWERWEVASRGRRQTVYFMQGALPPLSGPELVRKLASVKRVLNPSKAEEEAQELRSIIGQGSSTFFDPERPYNSQASDLLRILNREDLFEDFTLADSVYLLAIAPPPTGMGVRLFLVQVLLGYELYLRLRVCDNASSFPGITQQVNSTLEVAVRWVESVSSELSDGQLKVYSKIHESQVEGLVAFAEAMKWPFLDEVKQFAPTAYANHLNGNLVDVHFLDWLYGTCLPGRWFAWKCMTSTIYASQSLRSYGTTPYFDAGLVLEQCSYWRARTPLARVLGGLSGVNCLAGWVGPCPPIVTEAGKPFTGWIRVRSTPADFSHIPAPVDEMTEDEHELQDRGLRVRAGETPRGLLNELADMTKWVLPKTVPKSATVAKLLEARLELLPLEDDEDIASQQAHATVVFSLDDAISVEYKLVHNPVIVSSPPCISGPHLAHARELERYSHVVDVRDLKTKATSPLGTMLLINATGGGDAEAVARAWCSEVGRHAVVSKGNTTCLTCSFNTTENLELDVLIVS